MDIRLVFIIIIMDIMILDIKMATAMDIGTCDAVNSQISIKFQYVSPNDWKNNIIKRLKISTAKSVSEFCSTNMTECGIKRTSSFTKKNVVISGGPREDLIHTLLSLYVTIPNENSINITCLFIRKPILTEIIIKNREGLHDDLKIEAGGTITDSWAFRISNVDGIRTLPPLNSSTDYIIISAVCVFILLLGITVAVLEVQSKREHQRHLNRVIQEKQNSKNSSSPSDGSFAMVRNITKAPTMLSIEEVQIAHSTHGEITQVII